VRKRNEKTVKGCDKYFVSFLQELGDDTKARKQANNNNNMYSIFVIFVSVIELNVTVDKRK